LASLKEVSERDPDLAARGRLLYLEQARSLREAKIKSSNQNSTVPGVSNSASFRLNEWLNQLIRPFTERRQSVMLNIVLALIISSTLMLGGGGAAVYASRDSLPDEPLYGIKTWSEDLTLELEASPQQKMEKAMYYADRRLMEMTQVKQAGSNVETTTTERLNFHLNYALRLAVGLSDEEVLPALTWLRTRLEQQRRQMEALQEEHPNDPALEQVRQRLQELVRMANLGLEDPLQLRQQLRSRSGESELPEEDLIENGQGGEGPRRTPAPNSYGIGPNQPTNPVQQGFGPGPQLSGTPAAQPGQYGPGPLQPEATPQGGLGPGPGPNGESPSDPAGPQDPAGPTGPNEPPGPADEGGAGGLQDPEGPGGPVESPGPASGNGSGSGTNGGNGSGGNQGGGH
jgi:hypothetical protein